MLRLKFLSSLLICFLLNSELSFAQNLVPNASFEDYSTCPDGPSQIANAVPWQGINNSTDYFNVCSSTVGVPSYCNCSMIFQYPNSGNAYAGIWLYNGPTFNYREYLSAELNSTLVEDQCYIITLYTNLQNSTYYAVNNLGIHLSDTATSSPSFGTVLNLVPQVLYFQNKVISDTLAWTKVSGIFISNGSEKYITIGNYCNDSLTDTLSVANGSYQGAYYYIDDVSVIAISELPNAMPAYAGEDQYIEIGDSIFIGQEISNLNSTWSILGGAQIADSISGIWVNPTQTTTYVVEQNLCGVITYDTVTVFVHGVGLDENSSTNFFEVFPNPNTGKFYIQTDDFSFIKISDLQGRSINYSLNKLDDKTFIIPPIFRTAS